MSVTGQILELCSDPNGRTVPELEKILNKYNGYVRAILIRCLAAGKLHRCGIKRKQRYFTSAEHARAFEDRTTPPRAPKKSKFNSGVIRLPKGINALGPPRDQGLNDMIITPTTKITICPSPEHFGPLAKLRNFK